MAQLLVIADKDSAKSTAINRAVVLAEKLGDSVHIVSFAYEPLVDMSDMVSKSVAAKVRKSAIEERKASLDSHIATLKSDVKIKASVIWAKDVADWVVDHVSKKKYRYVIKTAAHTGNMFYTSTDWRLMRESPVPPMILAARKWKKRNHVLATVDFSSRSKIQKALNQKVLDEALELAEKMEGDVHVCYVAPVLKVLGDLDIIDAGNFKKKMKASAQKAMDALVGDRIAASQQHILFGEPERKIPSQANKLKADLVIMGSAGRKGLKGKMLGNTAEKTLNKLFTDIVTLRV